MQETAEPMHHHQCCSAGVANTPEEDYSRGPSQLLVGKLLAAVVMADWNGRRAVKTLNHGGAWQGCQLARTLGLLLRGWSLWGQPSRCGLPSTG